MRAELHTAELLRRRPPPPPGTGTGWSHSAKVSVRAWRRGPPPDRLARFLVSMEERPWTLEAQQHGLRPFGNVRRPLSATRAAAGFLGTVISGEREASPRCRVEQMDVPLCCLKWMSVCF